MWFFKKYKEPIVRNLDELLEKIIRVVGYSFLFFLFECVHRVGVLGEKKLLDSKYFSYYLDKVVLISLAWTVYLVVCYFFFDKALKKIIDKFFAYQIKRNSKLVRFAGKLQQKRVTNKVEGDF